MPQELKIKVLDPTATETTIKTAGAAFVAENSFVDTYFKQPPGDVFKVSDSGKGYFLVTLKKTPDGKFEVVKSYEIDNSAQVISEMSTEYGVKCVLKGKRKNFTFGDFKITLSMIDDRGAFLIVTGENPTPEVITKLGLENPEFVTVSFDELPALSISPAAPSPSV